MAKGCGIEVLAAGSLYNFFNDIGAHMVVADSSICFVFAKKPGCFDNFFTISVTQVPPDLSKCEWKTVARAAVGFFLHLNKELKGFAKIFESTKTFLRR